MISKIVFVKQLCENNLSSKKKSFCGTYYFYGFKSKRLFLKTGKSKKAFDGMKLWKKKKKKEAKTIFFFVKG